MALWLHRAPHGTKKACITYETAHAELWCFPLRLWATPLAPSASPIGLPEEAAAGGSLFGAGCNEGGDVYWGDVYWGSSASVGSLPPPAPPATLLLDPGVARPSPLASKYAVLATSAAAPPAAARPVRATATDGRASDETKAGDHILGSSCVWRVASFCGVEGRVNIARWRRVGKCEGRS